MNSDASVVSTQARNVELKASELELANQLIEQLSGTRFEPDKYEDEYSKAVLEAVDRKVAGEEIVVMPETDTKDQIIDLVAALKQSLAGGEKAPAKKAAKAKPAAEKPAARKTAKAKASAPRKKRSAS